MLMHNLRFVLVALVAGVTVSGMTATGTGGDPDDTPWD
jgi:hypothetical protein